MVGLLSFTFTMSNYSYRVLSRCDKQLGSLRDHPWPDKDGDRALATEDKKSHVVRPVATVLYASSIKIFFFLYDFLFLSFSKKNLYKLILFKLNRIHYIRCQDSNFKVILIYNFKVITLLTEKERRKKLNTL